MTTRDIDSGSALPSSASVQVCEGRAIGAACRCPDCRAADPLLGFSSDVGEGSQTLAQAAAQPETAAHDDSSTGHPAWAVGVTYDARVYNGSTYCDYTGRTRYRVVWAPWSGAAARAVLDEMIAQQPAGSGERVTGITAISVARSAASTDADPASVERDPDRPAPETTITAVTECGSSGPYRLGYEHTAQWAGGPIREVQRPLRVDAFVGYGLFAGVGHAIMRISYDGEMTPWRSGPIAGPMSPCTKPYSVPYLHLPDEEHGHEWSDDPLAIPSTEPVRFVLGDLAITEAEARAACLAYVRAQPDWGLPQQLTDLEHIWPGIATEATEAPGDAKDMPGLAEELAGMSDADRRVAERVSDLGEIEPAPGYEERAVERAKLEGVLPPT